MTDIFYPVESSLTLKLSIQKLNGVNPFSLSPLAEGICQKIVAIFMGGKTKEGAEKGLGPWTPESVQELKRGTCFIFLIQGCSVRNSPHLIFKVGPETVSKNKSDYWVCSSQSVTGTTLGGSKWKQVWSEMDLGLNPGLDSYSWERELRQIV